MNRLTAILAAALLAAAPAAANDTTASFGAGGLVLERTDGIEMRSEHLYVSASEIRVDYRFFNRTGADITTVVAFPMPDIPGYAYGDTGLSYEDAAYPIPFTTTVDGRAVRTEVEQRAVVGGVDHTELLRGLNIPLAPHMQETSRALSALPIPQIERLAALGLVERNGWMDGDVERREDLPMWTLKTNHYWTQVFPAGRELAVNHRYTPAAGGTVATLIGDDSGDYREQLQVYEERYCTDADFVSAVRSQRARGLYHTETWVDYVLTTGANWAEPIGEFVMVVDKGEPGNLVSFCADGVRRISPTQFEVRRSNYTPTRDLSVLILNSVPNPY